jgi:putative Holliday junction resolvase
MGIDHGKKRVGVAISDDTGRLALPLEVVPGKDRHRLLSRIVELAAVHQVATIVVGHPLSLQGDSGPQARQVEDFAQRLGHKVGESIQVILWDERLTSRQVDLARPRKADRSEGARDLMAAVLILQTFLDGRETRL